MYFIPIQHFILCNMYSEFHNNLYKNQNIQYDYIIKVIFSFIFRFSSYHLYYIQIIYITASKL